MRRSIVLSCISFLLLGSFLFWGMACNDTVIDPFQNEDRLFTVWGFLNERQRDHVLRVIPITRMSDVIESPTSPNAEIDAVVRTIDLDTGASIQWAYKLEQLSDSTWGHVYRASFFIEHDHTYRLEIERADGRMAVAETRVPFLSSVRAELPPPTVENDSVYQDIIIPKLTTPWKIDLRYSLRPTVVVQHGRAGLANDNGGWRIKVNVTADLDKIAAGYGVTRDQIAITSMGVIVQVLDTSWSPPKTGDAPSVFDPTILVNPGTLSNVEDGYGYFGSVGLFQDDWEISAELAALLQ